MGVIFLLFLNVLGVFWGGGGCWGEGRGVGGIMASAVDWALGVGPMGSALNVMWFSNVSALS